MLKNYRDFKNKAVSIMGGLNNGKIVDYDLSEKVIDYQIWFNKINDKFQAGIKALNLKYKVGTDLIVSQSGMYMSGSKKDYEALLAEEKEFLKKEMTECPVSFERKEFKGSAVDAGIKTLMIDAGILK